MISPFEYCTKCGLVYCHIQNFECVVCHGELEPIEGLLIPEREMQRNAGLHSEVVCVHPNYKPDENIWCPDCGVRVNDSEPTAVSEPTP